MLKKSGRNLAALAGLTFFLLLAAGSGKDPGKDLEGIGTTIMVIFVMAVLVAIITAVSKNSARKQAKEAYDKALAELKVDPRNPEKRQRTLQLGREYSKTTRDDKGITVFDEVALMNDINAACAAATGPETEKHFTKTVERQVFVTRCKHCHTISPVGAPCEKCGAPVDL